MTTKKTTPAVNPNELNKFKFNLPTWLNTTGKTISVVVEEIKHVINLRPQKGFHFQMEDKSSLARETNIMVTIEGAFLFKEKKMKSILANILKSLNLVEYQTIGRIREKLVRKQGQFIVNPQFAEEAITADPKRRLMYWLMKNKFKINTSMAEDTMRIFQETYVVEPTEKENISAGTNTEKENVIEQHGTNTENTNQQSVSSHAHYNGPSRNPEEGD